MTRDELRKMLIDAWARAIKDYFRYEELTAKERIVAESLRQVFAADEGFLETMLVKVNAELST